MWCSKGRRGQSLIEAPGDNRRVYGFGLVEWREGWLMAESLQDAQQTCSASKCVPLWLVQNSENEWPASLLTISRLIRRLAPYSCGACRAEFKDHLYLVYTPANDPDTNRIECLRWVSRRVAAHNHHRSTFVLLLVDVELHFQALARTSAEALRHIGSSFSLLRSTMLLCLPLRLHNRLGT
jgi:hypothetical protein